MPNAVVQPDPLANGAAHERDDAGAALLDERDERETPVNVTITPLLLNVRQLGAILGGISERKIRAMVSTRQLPPPVKWPGLGRLTRWRRTDIEKHIASLN